MNAPVEQAPSVEAVVAATLVAHQRNTAGSCLCGWSELGRMHSAHVTEVLAQARLLADAPIVHDGFTIEAPPVAAGTRVEDLVVLLGRAAQLLRRRAANVTNPAGADGPRVHWFPDAQLDVLACVVTEGTPPRIVTGDLHADLAAYFATWDPATSTAAAVVLEHAARCIRLDGKVGDHQPAVELARQVMRRAGDAP